MANHKSALKRVKQDQMRKLRNKAVKTRVKNVVKAMKSDAAAKSETMGASLITAQSAIAKAAKKGVLSRRTAARKISRLAKLANRVNAAE